MSSTLTTADRVAGQHQPAWAAVVSMALGVFGLVTAEFLPASLLTPMAADLGISEGMAGQAVTATAVVALLTSLLLSTVIRGADRRHVLLAFSILLVASNLAVALAPNLTFLLFGRVLLGVALGGFWTMSAAIVMRLVPEALVPQALSMIFLGVSAATVLAVPVGSYVGSIFGWRSVFFGVAGLGVAVFAVQAVTLPRLAATGSAGLGTLVNVLLRPGVGLAMAAVTLVFIGHFAFFTYIRPFLETVPRVDAATVSAILLGFGLANFVGTMLSGPMIERGLRWTLLGMPLLMGLLGLALAQAGQQALASAAMIALWGFAFGAVPVAWSTWLTRAVPDEAETAGGLLVAAIQMAIAIGAAAGGVVFDKGGATSVIAAAGFVLLCSAVFIVVGVRLRPVVAAEA